MRIGIQDRDARPGFVSAPGNTGADTFAVELIGYPTSAVPGQQHAYLAVAS